MPRKTTAAFTAALAINFALAGGALMLANLNQPAAYNPDAELLDAYDGLDTVAGVKADPRAGDLVVPLKAAQAGGNTRVTFTGAKNIPTGREVHEGTWDQIAGAVLFRPDEQQLFAVEAVFDTRSLRTDAPGLTTTVTAKEKWFDIDNHPTATFTCDTISPSDAATPSYTHDLVGTFTLNGITKPLTIPARLAFSGQSLTLDASFTVLRSDYDVKKRSSSVAGTLGGVVSEVEDAVELTVRVTASPDPTAVIAELAALVESQQERLRVADIERAQLAGLERRLMKLEEQAGRLAASPGEAQTIDVASLPKRYTERVPDFSTSKPLDMVVVPGSDDESVQPFYMSKTEVTWSQFRYWAEGYDLDPLVHAQMILDGLQPSILFGPPSMTVQLNDEPNPAMAMTMRSAKAYCKWLSEETGRKYRLPTLQEWRHALEAGGGVPDNIDDYAWHIGNSPDSFLGNTKITSPAGSKKPNTLGIHDMLGGVSEWVTGTGNEEIVVGGTIFMKPEELTAEWKAVANLDVWSASYPSDPKSRYWYTDFYATGIRLVCEAPSIAANPPKIEGE